MGLLADAAKKNSNFLILAKGESIEVTYLSVRLVPSTMDPTKDVAQYKFSTPHGDKFWTNGNGKIMTFFDTLEAGRIVRIKRDKAIKADGAEDSTKSVYTVEAVNAG